MGGNGSVGNGPCRAGAASTETPAAGAYGRYQEAAGGRLPAWNAHPAYRPGKVQVVSGRRSSDHLSGIWPRGRTKLNGRQWGRALVDYNIVNVRPSHARMRIDRGCCANLRALADAK